MKNFYKLLIAFVVLVGSAELTKAQSTFEAPYPGSTHTYNFDNIDAASTTTWYISKAATIDAAAITTDTDFTLSASVGGALAVDGILTGKGISEVKIFWKGVASGTYYLFVNVNDGNCSNVKGIQIIVGDGEFNAMIADVTGASKVSPTDPTYDATYDTDNITTETCPDQSTISPIVNLDPNTHSYGTSEIVYRVDRQFTNTTNGWQVTFDDLRAGARITGVVKATGTAGVYTVAGTQDYFLVTVEVDNAIATGDVILTINSAGTMDLVTNAADKALPDDNSATHTFKAMPTIGVMGGN